MNSIAAMNSIVEIYPKELKFVVELKKQSSCSVRLTNTTDHHVAFKVKTTSPKKYCVRPNVGVIMPRSSCEFSVTMQAQRTLPDVECRDKFLIQSTMVSSETTDADLTAGMFAKGDGKYIEEKRLRVIFTSSPDSHILSPIKVDLNQGQGHEAVKHDQVFGGVEALPQKMVTKDVKFTTFNSEEPKPSKDTEVNPPMHVEFKPTKDEGLKPAKAVELKLPKYEELKTVKDVEWKLTNAVDMEPDKNVVSIPAWVADYRAETNKELKSAKNVEVKEDVPFKLAKSAELDTVKHVEDVKLVKDIQEMKSKLTELELKLSQAQATILKLTEERGSSIQEIKKLQEQLKKVSKSGMQQVQTESPSLFGCTVALISVVLVTVIAVKSMCMKIVSSL